MNKNSMDIILVISVNALRHRIDYYDISNAVLFEYVIIYYTCVDNN